MTENNTDLQNIDSQGSTNILRLLDVLTATPPGNVIFRQVKRVLNDAERTHSSMVRGYASLTYTLLGVYIKQLPKNSLLYLELRLIQKRLMPPISITELGTLQIYVKNVTKLMAQVTKADEVLLREALSPLLANNSDDIDFGDDPVARMLHNFDQQPAEKTPAPSKTDIAQSEFEQQPVQETVEPAKATVEQNVSSAYRKKLNQQHRDIQDLRTNLANKVEATAQQYHQFGALLKVSLQKLKLTPTINSIDGIRQRVSGEVEKLLSAQETLERMLHDTQSYLQLIGSNSQKMSEELDQVRVLSLTDDLTGLPNRRAFLRRLGDEIVRAQRYQTILTLAIIDLDDFKGVNDKYGHSVGDEILRVYAQDVLSIFRRYDMVARYGGEEFAVLLPNTDKDGALRAFRKVKKKAYETFSIIDGRALLVPTFSAGLAIHKPGETFKKLIERADAALYRAKQHGRNRVELDASYLGEKKEVEAISS